MDDRAIRLQQDVSALKTLTDDCLYLQGELWHGITGAQVFGLCYTLRQWAAAYDGLCAS